MNVEERPREKALKYGCEYLSNRELLAILLRSGIQNHSVMDLAGQILSLRKHIGYLQNVKLHELMAIKGISKVKALEIMACLELSRRISYECMKQEDVIRSPSNCIEWLNKKIGFSDQEHFLVLFLDVKGHVIDEQELFIGSSKECKVSPKLIYKRAMEMNSDHIMLVHNHPSGSVEPSDDDIDLTNHLVKMGYFFGIEVIDHIIVGENRYFSFKEKMIID